MSGSVRSSDRRHTTGQTTSDRFARLSGSRSGSSQQPLVIDEDVSIVIERKVRGPPSTEPLVRRFDPDVDVIRLARRTNEGSAPVFQRPELLKFQHDRLSPRPRSRSPPRTYSSVRRLSGGDGYRERRSIRMALAANTRGRHSRSRSRSPVILRQPPSRPIHDRIGARFASLSPSPPLGHQRVRRRPIAERLGQRPVDSIDTKYNSNSNRFYYKSPGAEAAALDPLATPKAPSYFMHDDRSSSANDQRFRRGAGRGGGGGFGRRGFRRGGGGRGGFGGGGGGGIEGKWQHDKFVDDEDEAMGSEF